VEQIYFKLVTLGLEPNKPQRGPEDAKQIIQPFFNLHSKISFEKLLTEIRFLL
jgi:hypothetical protein